MTTKPHIVVFSSSPNLLKLYQIHLGSAGYRVTARLQVLENIAFPNAQRPHLILMSYFEGRFEHDRQFIEAVRRHDLLCSVPILVCTSMSLMSDAKALAQGMSPAYVVGNGYTRNALLPATELALSAVTSA